MTPGTPRARIVRIGVGNERIVDEPRQEASGNSECPRLPRLRGFELEEPEDLGQRRIAFRKIEPLSD